jgi:DNA-binding IclR family transcriptional regulator
VSGPRDIIGGLSRRGSASLIVDHMATEGPTSADDISQAYGITRAGARAQLINLRASGVAELEDRGFRLMTQIGVHRYYLDPDALRYAARWLDALAERAEQANRAAAFVPLPAGRSR